MRSSTVRHSRSPDSRGSTLATVISCVRELVRRLQRSPQSRPRRESRGERKHHVQRQANRTAGLHPQRAADHVIDAADPDPPVGGDGRCREPGDEGGGRDDVDGHRESHAPDHSAEPQIHYHAEDRQDRWREHTAESPKAICASGAGTTLKKPDPATDHPAASIEGSPGPYGGSGPEARSAATETA